MMMFSFERANLSARVTWLSLVGLVLVPLLVAGGFLWATWNSDSRLDKVEAAVINLDEPVKLDGQLVPLGRQLAGGLVSGGEASTDSNFTWVLTDQQDAADGLMSGKYSAAVTIPEDFSARATSFSKSESDQIEPAEIIVEISQIRGIADTAVGQSIAAGATNALNNELTEQYLENIYVGFNTTGKQFRTVAKAADDLSAGTTQLADGLGESAVGADQLADGLSQLDNGADQLSTGATQLSNGVSQLSTGVGRTGRLSYRSRPGDSRKAPSSWLAGPTSLRLGLASSPKAPNSSPTAPPTTLPEPRPTPGESTTSPMASASTPQESLDWPAGSARIAMP
jgi:putative membrane protein